MYEFAFIIFNRILSRNGDLLYLVVFLACIIHIRFSLKSLSQILTMLSVFLIRRLQILLTDFLKLFGTVLSYTERNKVCLS